MLVGQSFLGLHLTIGLNRDLLGLQSFLLLILGMHTHLISDLFLMKRLLPLLVGDILLLVSDLLKLSAHPAGDNRLLTGFLGLFKFFLQQNVLRQLGLIIPIEQRDASDTHQNRQQAQNTDIEAFSHVCYFNRLTTSMVISSD